MTRVRSTILVVDDNENNRDLLTRRLHRQGYHTQTAEHGQQALEAIFAHEIDLVLLDMMMPVMNGFQVLEHMRAHPTLRHLPVIVISSMNDMDSVTKAIELGAADYLPKPCNPTLLKARVGACLEKKRLRDLEQMRLAELAQLQRIDRELNTSLDLQQIMHITLGWAVRQAQASAGWIGLVEAGGLRVMATQGYSAESALALQSYLPNEHPVMQAALRAVCPQQDMVAPHVLRFLSSATVQTVVPVLRDERMIGVLLLERADCRPCTDETRAFLGRLCDHAAIAIANAQLHEAAQAANLAKSEFVSLVVHELRTPIAAIKGFTDLMERGGFGPISEQQEECVQLIRVSLSTMIALVSDLADISRIEAGQLRLECSVISMPNVIREVVDSMSALCDARSQMLTVSLAPEMPMIWADRMRLHQILTNLLSNAHKYTPDGGQITVSVMLGQDLPEHLCSAEAVHVTVGDTGFGLSTDDQQRVFQKFFRSAQQAVREQAGTGLGLSITKHLVELQGGQVWFESALDVGTTFHFTMPLAPAEALVSLME